MKSVRTRWFRAILVVAIVLVVAFTVGRVWAYLMMGLIGLIAGYALGFVNGLYAGQDLAAQYLFDDEMRGVYQEFMVHYIEKQAKERQYDGDIEQLRETFRKNGLGLPIVQKGTVRHETERELAELRASGLE